jgi:hypothetical protein
MKCALPLVLVAILGANCASRTISQANRNAVQNAPPNAPPIKESAKPETTGGDKVAATKPENEVPPEFKNVDFKNFTYPASFEKGSVRLRDGKYEYEQPMKEGGGGENFDLHEVSFVDLAGDGKKEAVVVLHWISCGASCDGGSYLFYVYSSRKNKPVLFWRIESGSGGYGCGLKSLTVDGRNINLELFNNCRYKGATPVSKNTEGELGKFSAVVYTRFIFKSDGKKVVLKKRGIFPFPEGSAKNYPAELSIK